MSIKDLESEFESAKSATTEAENAYMEEIGMKYVFTKAHSDNLYSINNMYKDGYELVDEWLNERGPMSAFLKKL